MKAIVSSVYGSPDTLRLKDVPKPTPAGKQVLVKVHAASANPLDWHKMRGAPFLVRLGGGFFAPQDHRLGADMAGTVEAIGDEVSGFKVGDEVFGANAGAFAEYAIVADHRIALKPANVSFEQAAATPVAAITALQGLRDAGKIAAGQMVLINGAAGGVGTMAVQIAKAFGAEVTGVCSTRNLDLVRSIGAEHVIDYTAEDFTRIGQRYDLIFDLVANHPAAEYARALKPQGVCVVGGFSTLLRVVEYMVIGPRLSKVGGQQIGMMATAEVNKSDMEYIAGMLADGKIIPVIEQCYSLEETAEAIRHIETGHARGKVVVTVGNSR